MPLGPSPIHRLSLALVAAQVLSAQAAPITADRAVSIGPDAHFLRGVVAAPEDAMAGQLKLVNVDISLQDSPAFRRVGDHFEYRFDPARMQVEAQAVASGLSIIHQVSGTPAAIPSDPRFGPFGADYHWSLPDLGKPMQEWQDLFVRWARDWDRTVGGASYHSIWIGTQEPTHTLGAPHKSAGAEPSEDVQDLNIARFIDFWKPIAASLRASGAPVGGIQLPSGSQRRYQHAVDLLKQKDVELDYLTFQLYRLGDPRSLQAAVDALKSYQQRYPKARLLIDRGLWFKTQAREHGQTRASMREGHDSSEGMIWFLRAEKQIQAQSEFIAGYCIGKPGPLANMSWSVLQWLDAAPQGRRLLSGLPAGLDGFYLADAQRNAIALWNEGDAEQEVSIALAHAAAAPNAKLTVLRGEGRQLQDISAQTHWDGQTIAPLKLGPHQFVLVSL